MKYTINKDPKGPLYITEDEMKLNYNCPADQKSGEGKGSCGGADGKEGSASKASGSKNFSTKIKERFGGRNIMDVENDDLSLSELKEKLSVAKEGHDDDVAEIVEKDIKARESLPKKGEIVDHHEIALKKESGSNKTTFTREDYNRSAEVIKNSKTGDYDVKLDDGRIITGRSKGNAETLAKNYAVHGYKKGSREVAIKK